jgi:hypothetical protein
MTNFTFKAPTLFEPEAIPSDSLLDALHDARGMAAHLAKIKKFALWLEAEFDKKALAAKGPFVDEGGWLFEVPSSVGFVICIVSGPERDDVRFHMLVSQIGGASAEVGHAIEAILRDAGEIIELEVGQ